MKHFAHRPQYNIQLEEQKRILLEQLCPLISDRTYGSMESDDRTKVDTNSLEGLTLDPMTKGENSAMRSPSAMPCVQELLNKVSFLMAATGVITCSIFMALGEYEIYAAPLLLSASICILLSVSASSKSNDNERRRRPGLTSLMTLRSRMCSCASAPSSHRHRLSIGTFQNLQQKAARNLITILSIFLIFLPCLIYIANKFQSELHHGISRKSHSHLANDLGKLSFIAMGFFLVPVSRHSILLKSAGISASHAIRMHIWAGVIAITSGLGHGLYWIWIWMFIRHETLKTVFPEKKCWVWGDTGSKCEDQFVNLLGIICGVCFIGLGLTSLWWVRRNYYRVFYVSHCVFSVLLLFGLAMHYRKFILYISPGLLYYLASCMPVWTKSLLSWIQGGIRISNVTHIPGSRGCVEVVIGMDPSFQDGDVVQGLKETCGKFVRICVPEISAIWHPFTVFNVSSGENDAQKNGFRILFRTCGPFTKGLSKRLSDTQRSRPKLLVDGFYNGPNQLAQAAMHETVVIVAGGVGIATYLSLLTYLKSISRAEGNSDLRTKHVIVHWICRDEGLIKYVVENYINGGELLGDFSIDFVLHHTSKASEDSVIVPTPQGEPQEDWNDDEVVQGGSNFMPSEFLGRQRIVYNVISFATFSAIGWGGYWIVHHFYKHVQKTNVLYTNLYSIFVVLALSIVVSILSLIVMNLWSVCCKRSYTKLDIAAIESIERERSSSVATTSLTTETDLESQDCQIQVEHSVGRPDVSELINNIRDHNNDVGVFMCGPSVLLQSVRDAIEKRDGLCSTQTTAIYEELFEL